MPAEEESEVWGSLLHQENRRRKPEGGNVRGDWMSEARQYEDIDRAALARAKRTLMVDELTDPKAMPCKPIEPEDGEKALDTMLAYLDSDPGQSHVAKLRDTFYLSPQVARSVVAYWRETH